MVSRYGRWRTIGAGCALALLAVASAPRAADSGLGRVISRQHLSEERHGVPLTADNLVALRQIGGTRGALMASPNGRLLLFSLREPNIADNTVHLSWWIAPVDGTPVWRLADGGEPIPDLFNGVATGSALEPRAIWSPNGDDVAFVFLERGAAKLGVANVERRTVQSYPLGSGEVSDFRWANNDEIELQFAPVAPLNARDRDHGYLYDGRFAPSVSLSPLRETLDAPAASTFIWRRGRGVSPTPAAYAQEDIPTGALLHTRSVSGAVGWTQYTSPSERGYFATARVALREPSGRAQICAAPECTGAIDQLFWSNDGTSLYFVKREGPARAERSLYVWPGSNAQPRRILYTSNMLDGCAAIQQGAACIMEAPTQPRTISTFNAATGAMHILYDPNPQFAQTRFGAIERITVQDAFGNVSFAHLVYPIGYQAGRSYPLVIVQYRWRGFLNGGVGNEYPIHLFAQMGFMVLEIDRPEDRALGARLDVDALQSAYVRDAYVRRMCFSALGAYIDDLVRRGLVDQNRIGLTGLSDGADSVFYALMHQMPAAAAIVSTPPTDPYDYYTVSESNRAFLNSSYDLHDPSDTNAAHGASDRYWRAIAPSYAPDVIRTPLLMELAQGEFIRALPFRTRMIERRKPLEMYVFNEEHHIKSQPRHLEAILTRNLAWFDFWLNHNDAPAGVDAAALARWRQMRAHS